MKMSIDEIIVRPGRRETAAHDVRELAESMKALGLLNLAAAFTRRQRKAQRRRRM